jgi:uncharacterized protein
LKVERSSGKMKNLTNIGSSQTDKKVESKDNHSFLGFMDKASDMSYVDKMKMLTDRIFEQGDKLGKRIDVKELRVYKSLMTEFLNEVVSNAHKYTKTSKLDRRGRHKVFATVKKINEELDDLTTEMLKAQQDGIKILRRIQDIRGLVLDLQL